MTEESTEIVQWLGLRMRVPKEWEIVRHSLSLENGNLVFVDRRRERMRVYWRDCRNAPDLARMLDDQRGKESLEHPGAKLRELNGHAGWQGFIREQDDERVLHAAHFDSSTMRLIEVIVTESGDEASSKSARARLLGNICVTSRAERARDFFAFGLGVTVPDGFRLTKASVKPADVAFEFAEFSGEPARPSGVSAVVHRRGMAAAWAPDDKRALLARESPQFKLRDIQSVSWSEHAAWSATGQEKRPRLMNWLGLGRRGETLLWHCDATNAIYSIATAYPRRKPLETRAFSTTCGCEVKHE